MRRRAIFVAGIAFACALAASQGHATDRATGLGLCAAMARSKTDEPKGDSIGSFLPSYLSKGTKLPKALQNTAFVYDNALAAMAFLACGQVERARSIGEALISAGKRDRYYTDGRLRNAYRSGYVDEKIALPGWWDDGAKSWIEDEYQISTASGNVAWAALALLQLHHITKDPKYLEEAERLGSWLEQLDGRDEHHPGVAGGYYGFEPNASRIAWKSTEHNIDIVAVSRWLWMTTENPRWHRLAQNTLRFVSAMHDDKDGFLIGTDAQEQAVHSKDLWLDVQIWPLLAVPEAQRPAPWNDAANLIDRRLSVPGGYDFNGDRDGLWIEGTAQAALMFSLEGEPKRASTLIGSILQHVDPESGWLYATPSEQLSTGLTIDAMGQGGAFMYHHWPHLGATAWAVLAAMDFNPFQPN
ncbi:hypothetical protein CU103_24555 [Phyllobacterium sophorae]|uniref:Methylaspartate ammonia-lyase n=2 Tax=Phyllobacterium sophorae TaxID=1520277 RepID=A0A2P7B3Q7_9HYPH|nr:hypothetical protein CU103_24555 [Phyllobacterium sophorae]